MAMDYKQIKADFESGVLNKDHDIMVVDNDECFLDSRGSSLSADERDARYEVLKKKYGRGGGPYDFDQLLDLLGIPNEHC